MVLTFFLKGIIIGFAMAIPVGPIGIMCIRKVFTEGRLQGFIIGLGATTADLLYSCIAAFGLTFISNTLMSQKIWIRLIGGALLLFLGTKTFISLPKDPRKDVSKDGNLRSYFTIVFLTLTNPMTIFVFLAIFAALGMDSGLNYLSASALVVGVFIGLLLWFLILSSGITLFRNKLDIDGLKWVNKIAGILIIISGIIAIANLF
ncbi:MAG: LysE family transporter [Melioribacteraceae bacterium]|nr:LysE family transporter [Melioribacteraceae bacterium]